LHQHAGEDQKSNALKNHNKILFDPFDTVLIPATGCTAVLYEQFGDKIQDITVYLNQFDFLPKSPQISHKILLHSPCTLKNVLHQENMPEKLLQKIPGIEMIKLDYPHCCGASGSYFLEYPQMAEKLAENLLKEVKQISPSVFVTSNIGCALHLRRLFKKYQIHIPIKHPVNILAAVLQ
jgi:glycolate oxidase iron-sulfur subunit